MRHVVVPRIGAARAWRDTARDLLLSGVPPEEVTWGGTGQDRGLFDTPGPGPASPSSDRITVPRSFLQMADTVIWHSDPTRFARLYAFLWRLKEAPHLMSDRGDAQLSRLRQMEKNVRRCQHKMKAFVRFREIGDPTDPRRSFAAWFEPTHHTVEPAAGFFARRFADMDWRILTPDISAVFENGKVRFEEDHPRPDLPEDASETLWVTYFRNIFNPARLKVQAMQSEMPKKYWKNMPEAAAIPELIAGAPARAREMALNAPSLPPSRMAAVQAQQAHLTSAWDGLADDLPRQIRACTRCPLHRSATQAVPGEGPLSARLMIVAEQPGDQEDLQGRPLVGPAGQLFDRIAGDAGLDRNAAFITNAVKHFKFRPRGRQRIHQRPDAGETEHCRWWLESEINLIRPVVILALGATAALSLTGSGTDLMQRRGRAEAGPGGIPVLITLHPAYLLRQPDVDKKAAATDQFRSDLALAQRMSEDTGSSRERA
ncbi:UdgX family uracil-DNA binding protein [Roseobacter ponti]|uniref:Type-4 uracil-DNA glycosylase n=1 Tax=Roseobacter ponti TaxID=1891787 RepID=A0A858SL60_9RHOB|nr:UdgX family uracil-DNA binding protein [Roseobacter ponti]QJF49669.1 UdgX family uracil-DNA binding protein [Roseobacter ponti]